MRARTEAEIRRGSHRPRRRVYYLEPVPSQDNTCSSRGTDNDAALWTVARHRQGGIE